MRQVAVPVFDDHDLSSLKGLIPTREEVEAAGAARAGRDFLARCTGRSQLMAGTALVGLTPMPGAST